MIIDTNALSDLAQGVHSIAQVLRKESSHSIPANVLGEFRYGLALSKHHKVLETWLDRQERIFPVLEITASTARHYASIRSELKRRGKPIPEADLWIAALALEHDLSILSHDTHFDLVPGVSRVDW